MRAFGQYGYSATSLDDVAAAAGIRKQSVLYHFPGKDELFAAAAFRAAQVIADALDRALNLRGGGEVAASLDRITLLVSVAHDLARRRPEVVALVREVARLGPPLSDRVAEALRPLVDAAVAWLERGMDEGWVRRQNPRVALVTMYSAVVSYLTESSVKRAILSSGDRREARDELVAFLRAALAP